MKKDFLDGILKKDEFGNYILPPITDSLFEKMLKPEDLALLNKTRSLEFKALMSYISLTVLFQSLQYLIAIYIIKFYSFPTSWLSYFGLFVGILMLIHCVYRNVYNIMTSLFNGKLTYKTL